ncbi:MAG: phage tail protein [Acidiphilium sp. 37-64-53]|uniref:phage tail protein n=1 Tax=Acidiphilium TaxID=522 RepID=UPI000BCCE147|nr:MULTISPECIES: phage tail protein [Acidiphilium]OYW01426.1 MAG: phage tail protein [Acidiphilium sp. 37-64-53]OZB25994.1 MAG: phage tail protein [Acidiphilium sp. 34-64-41]HQT85939.1 phage tail protein [Acidiphilium rubrum]
MPISQAGALNTTALIVPDLYVQIVPPQSLLLNGVPTDVLGVVGSASWGPVNEPMIVGSMGDYATAFGPVMARQYDIGTVVAIGVQQGASNFRCVRVTDGTDTAASVSILGALTLTALYTGSLGSALVATVSVGSAANSWRVTVALPGQTPEVFDNIIGSGAAFWQAVASAINIGTGPMRGASRLVVASAGTSSLAPSVGAFPFLAGSPGTDGATGMTSGMVIGQDVVPRSGMYALRGQGCSIIVLADLDDPTQWSTEVAFGLDEGCYMILAGPPGDTIANAVLTKQTAGIDSYAAKLMFGDWLWWYDQANGVTRLVSPQGFAAGRLANLSPEQSSLNKPLYGVVGSQKSGQAVAGTSNTYSTADLAALLSAGIDVISNPQPGGAFWGVRGGHNSSSDSATNGDNYTRMTNYIADTLSAGMGGYVGQLVNTTLFQNIRSTLLSFLNAMLGQRMLGSTNGSLPFAVVCDISNNPPSRTGLGYVQADVQVQYQAINEKFIVNVEGGQTVQVSQQTLPLGTV